MKCLLFLILIAFNAVGSDSEFLKRPPLSSKCQAMLDKKGELDNAIYHAKTLIERADRLAKSVRYDRKSSQARAKGLKARLEIKKEAYLKRRTAHFENLIREGCPTFQ